MKLLKHLIPRYSRLYLSQLYIIIHKINTECVFFKQITGKKQTQQKQRGQFCSSSTDLLPHCLIFPRYLNWNEWEGRSLQPDCLHSLTAQGSLGNLSWFMSVARLLDYHCHSPGCCCVFILRGDGVGWGVWGSGGGGFGVWRDRRSKKELHFVRLMWQDEGGM